MGKLTDLTATTILELDEEHITNIKFFLQIDTKKTAARCINKFIKVYKSGNYDVLSNGVMKQRKLFKRKKDIILDNNTTITMNRCYLLSDTQLFFLRIQKGNKYQALEYDEVKNFVQKNQDYVRRPLSKKESEEMKEWLNNYKYSHLSTLELPDAIKYVFDVYIPLARNDTSESLLQKLIGVLPIKKEDIISSYFLLLDKTHLDYINSHFGIKQNSYSLFEQRCHIVNYIISKCKTSEDPLVPYEIVLTLYDVIDMYRHNWGYVKLITERSDTKHKYYLNLPLPEDYISENLFENYVPINSLEDFLELTLFPFNNEMFQ